jgi:hypothetical protein
VLKLIKEGTSQTLTLVTVHSDIYALLCTLRKETGEHILSKGNSNVFLLTYLHHRSKKYNAAEISVCSLFPRHLSGYFSLVIITLRERAN